MNVYYFQFIISVCLATRENPEHTVKHLIYRFLNNITQIERYHIIQFLFEIIVHVFQVSVIFKMKRKKKTFESRAID